MTTEKRIEKAIPTACHPSTWCTALVVSGGDKLFLTTASIISPSLLIISKRVALGTT